MMRLAGADGLGTGSPDNPFPLPRPETYFPLGTTWDGPPMSPEFLSRLRCPYCGGDFRFAAAPLRAPLVLESGVLRCGCSAFPVIDGIPVIQKTPVGAIAYTAGATQAEGVPIARLVELLEAGRTLEALLGSLEVPGRLGHALARRLPGSAARSPRLQSAIRYPFRRRMRSLLRHRARTSVRDLLGLWFHKGSFLGESMGTYFRLRFCQPRHLAALALLEAVPASGKPVLDIACGLGHLEHYLSNRPSPAASIGLDMNFFQVWIAKHWFAPGAEYVCADAGDGLPFADGAFSAVLCSDAYHYIPNRPGLLAAIERCAPGSPVVLTRLGNRAVMPNEGAERDPAGYREELGPHAGEGLMAFTEEELVRDYLAARNPFARVEKLPSGLERAKWLTFAWNLTAPMRAAIPDARTRPHTVGRPGLNPIYRIGSRSRGRMRLRFEFPLPWYAYENHGMLAYHPQYAEIAESDLSALSEWERKEELRKLVDSFVLIGLPERFGA